MYSAEAANARYPRDKAAIAQRYMSLGCPEGSESSVDVNRDLCNRPLVVGGFSWAAPAAPVMLSNVHAEFIDGSLLWVGADARLEVERVRFLLGGEGPLLARLLGEVERDDSGRARLPFETIVELRTADPVRVELEARSADLDLIDSQTVVAGLPACTFPLRFEADKMDYHLTSEPPEGTDRVVYTADGWPLPDDTTGLRHSEGDGFPLDYGFSTAG